LIHYTIFISVNNFKIIDTDKDGVMDQLDIEPNTPAGVMVYGNGKAVDSDKDGLPDYKDKCPLKYGPISNEGCPLNIDSDGDGIMDGEDLCPNTPGVIENRGCPKQEVGKPENVTQQIGLLAASIYFDTNSDKIKSISFATIDKIINLMKKIPNVKFVIEGHTDDRNSDRYNLYLSQRRAASVRKYMVKQGIVTERLQSKGYGESRPKFSNGNAGGRQLNRRVEIKPVGSLD
jgi:outer membrane protein OmpA-like peptidoglycan-associated protein